VHAGRACGLFNCLIQFSQSLVIEAVNMLFRFSIGNGLVILNF